jgi:hypothetical protein
MYDLPKMLFQPPVEIPTAVARKSLTDWSRLMDYQKPKRVAFQNGTQDIWSFSQYESRN